MLRDMAEVAEQDREYQIDVDMVMKKLETKQIPDSSELKMIEGSLADLGIVEIEGKKLITKDSTQVMVPKAIRTQIMQKLHGTHLGVESMLRIARKGLY